MLKYNKEEEEAIRQYIQRKEHAQKVSVAQWYEYQVVY